MGISVDTGSFRLQGWRIALFATVAFTVMTSFFSSRTGAGTWWILDLAAAVGGGFMVRSGFRQLRKKNMIENVPTSAIRSVAMGLAEIHGMACAEAALSAPLSGERCHYFRYRVEEERTRSKGGKEWVTVDHGTSNVPFPLEDSTGKIQVDPQGADVSLQRDYRRVDAGEGWFGRRKRYSEWRIDPRDRLYVLGTVSKQGDSVETRGAGLSDRLRRLKRDPAAVKRFDLDDSGALDEQEWAGAVAVTKQELLQEETAKQAGNPQAGLFIGAGDTESTFMISDRDETSITLRLAWKAIAGVGLGGAVLLGMSVSILGRFGILRGGWSFPWAVFFG
ncbi:MAG TPA: GIDE domain-containing protein [Candidatus Polarisedimenticolia bacterium]|nr:GIDE domain-containing protein [Candidatus Polarisedimenticolia bacterium]